jgi:hypothetical protein
MLVIADEYGSDSFAYKIQNEKTVEFDGMVFEIRNLTANSVTLYAREDYGPGNYEEVAFTLAR